VTAAARRTEFHMTGLARFGFLLLALVIGLCGVMLALPAHGLVLDLSQADVAPAVAPSAPVVSAQPPAGVPTSFDSSDAIVQAAALALHAASAHDWKFLIGLLLLVAVWGLRKGAAWVEAQHDGIPGRVGAFFNSQLGGTILVFLCSAAGALGSALLAHQVVTAALAWQIAELALVAAGGWAAVVKPLVAWLQAKVFASAPAVTK
jgi:hypothetical protein